MKGDRYVQFGCWKDAPGDWLNYDCSPYLRVDRIPYIGRRICGAFHKGWAPFPDDVRYGDIVKGLPVPDNACKGVYCSHVLEHLCLHDFHQALRNTERLLVSGGVFRMVLPDLKYHVDRYFQYSGDPGAAPDFMQSTGLGEVERVRGVRGVAQELLGNSRHRWMWDYSSLQNELQAAGFAHIRKAEFGDSSDSKFADVERWDRWERCLGVECRKP